jgi:hypothetical protein
MTPAGKEPLGFERSVRWTRSLARVALISDPSKPLLNRKWFYSAFLSERWIEATRKKKTPKPRLTFVSM